MKILKGFLFSLLILFLFSYSLGMITIISLDYSLFKSNFVEEVFNDKKISLELYSKFEEDFLIKLDKEIDEESKYAIVMKKAILKTFDEEFLKDFFISIFNQYRDYIVKSEDVLILKLNISNQKEIFKTNLKIELKDMEINSYSNEEIDEQVDELFAKNSFQTDYISDEINTEDIDKVVALIRLLKNYFYIVSVVILGAVFGLMLLFKKLSKTIIWFGSTLLASSLFVLLFFNLLKHALVIAEISKIKIGEIISYSLVEKVINYSFNVSLISLCISLLIILSGFFFGKYGGLKNETQQ